VPVAFAFIVGGIIILWVEKYYTKGREPQVKEVDDMTWRDALKVGIAQAFALIPGTSRSGATIIGGMLFGLSRKVATEFSFFLAVPTLVAAGAYSLLKHRALLSVDDLGFFALGFVTAFMSAFICVRWLLRYITTHDFTIFAWYRIAFGLIVLYTAYSGTVQWAI
jgi:undecaprenyl-diphosphatase